MDTFLRVNGYTLSLTQGQKYELVLQVAQSILSKEDLTEYLQSVTMDSL